MKNYKVFGAFRTNSAGVWYFAPQTGVFKEGKPCKGFGAVKYREGSVYTGDLYYDGKNFNKLGFGRQDFSRSEIGCLIEGINERKYLFAGRYDYRKTDWIYGNGVLYYTDAEGKPSHFKKGFFSGLIKIKDYEGEFDYGALIDGYTPDMESDYDEDAERIKRRFMSVRTSAEGQGVKALFVGDSYFELFDSPEFAGENLFGRLFGEGCVNAGVGGSRFSDWLGWTDIFGHIPAPEKIFVNLGFNDLHSGYSVKTVYSNFRKFIKVLRGYYPEAEIYLSAVVRSPVFGESADRENEYNALIKDNARKLQVTVFDWNGLIEPTYEYFHPDGVHPNEKGYGIFFGELNKLLK